MTPIMLWYWFSRARGLLRSRWFWLAVAVACISFAGWRWHVSAVDAAVQANTTMLKAQFEQAKRDAVQAEADRAQTIINHVKGDYDAQIHDLNQRAARLLAEHRSGAVRLRVPVIYTACAVSGGDTSGTQSDTGAIAAETRAELSEQSVRFFNREAERADREAIEHNELVEIIEQLRAGKMGADR